MACASVAPNPEPFGVVNGGLEVTRDTSLSRFFKSTVDDKAAAQERESIRTSDMTLEAERCRVNF